MSDTRTRIARGLAAMALALPLAAVLGLIAVVALFLLLRWEGRVKMWYSTGGGT